MLKPIIFEKNFLATYDNWNVTHVIAESRRESIYWPNDGWCLLSQNNIFQMDMFKGRLLVIYFLMFISNNIHATMYGPWSKLGSNYHLQLQEEKTKSFTQQMYSTIKIIITVN